MQLWDSRCLAAASPGCGAAREECNLIALVSCDLLAVYLVGGHVLGEPAETVVDGEVAPLPPVVCLVDEAAELVVEHRCTFCLFDTDGG